MTKFQLAMIRSQLAMVRLQQTMVIAGKNEVHCWVETICLQQKLT
jgi:hypothetical protein